MQKRRDRLGRLELRFNRDEWSQDMIAIYKAFLERKQIKKY